MKVILFCTLWMMIVEVSFSQKSIVFAEDDNLDKGDISQYSEVYKDKTKSLTLEAIQTKIFTPFKKNILDTISYSDVCWLKFKIINKKVDTIHLTVNLQKQFFLDLYQVRLNKVIRSEKGGGFSQSFTSSSAYSLPISILPQDSCQIFIRVVFDTFHLQHKLLFLKLFSTKTAILLKNEAFSNQIPLFLMYFLTICFLLFGLFYGFLQFYSYQDKAILYYLIVIIPSLLIVLRVAELNLDFKILPNSMPLLHPFQLTLELVLACGYLLFFSTMFDLRTQKPRLYQISRILLAIYILLFIGFTFGTFLVLHQRIVFRHSFSVLGATTIFILLSTTGIVLSLLKTSNSYKKYIIYGYFFMFLGYAIMFFINRIRYDFSYNFWNIPSVYMCIGTTIELLFFMLALSQKGRFLEKEALMKGQINERQRVASELHNNVNSILASVKVSLQTIQPQTDKENKMYENVLKMMDNATREVRKISHNMLPVELEKEGLEHALQALVIRLNLGKQTQFELNLNGFEQNTTRRKMDAAIAFNLYTICLELCQNIQKHAEATQAQIEIQTTGNQLIMFVSDNGKGFDKNKVIEGMGLKNIRHRAKSIGADLRVQSEISEGTTVYLILKT
ncbi:sensor histidine kinase [Emticicia sp. SJ17W-69]|uniref:sensor histidine kinase n=1 Tax=Emticicia sp. SJ17W-69 TaxID=3421657 RepID=UPI003EB80312